MILHQVLARVLHHQGAHCEPADVVGLLPCYAHHFLRRSCFRATPTSPPPPSPPLFAPSAACPTRRAVLVQLGFYLHMRHTLGALRTAGGLAGAISRPVAFATAFMLAFSIVIALFKDIPDVAGDSQVGGGSGRWGAAVGASSPDETRRGGEDALLPPHHQLNLKGRWRFLTHLGLCCILAHPAMGPKMPGQQSMLVSGQQRNDCGRSAIWKGRPVLTLAFLALGTWPRTTSN